MRYQTNQPCLLFVSSIKQWYCGNDFIQEETVAWENRKSIAFRFKEVKLVLGAPPQSGQQTVVEAPQFQSAASQKSKTLKIRDIPQENKARFTLSSQSEYFQKDSLTKEQTKEKDWTIETEMPYSEYRTMYRLLEVMIN